MHQWLLSALVTWAGIRGVDSGYVETRCSPSMQMQTTVTSEVVRLWKLEQVPGEEDWRGSRRCSLHTPLRIPSGGIEGDCTQRLQPESYTCTDGWRLGWHQQSGKCHILTALPDSSVVWYHGPVSCFCLSVVCLQKLGSKCVRFYC